MSSKKDTKEGVRGKESEDETWIILGYSFNKVLKMCNNSQRTILKTDH